MNAVGLSSCDWIKVVTISVERLPRYSCLLPRASWFHPYLYRLLVVRPGLLKTWESMQCQEELIFIAPGKTFWFKFWKSPYRLSVRSTIACNSGLFSKGLKNLSGCTNCTQLEFEQRSSRWWEENYNFRLWWRVVGILMVTATQWGCILLASTGVSYK